MNLQKKTPEIPKGPKYFSRISAFCKNFEACKTFQDLSNFRKLIFGSFGNPGDFDKSQKNIL